MDIAIVLPRRFRFDVARPNSIETVVRTMNPPAGEARATVIVDAGADNSGAFPTRTIPGGLDRRARLRAILSALRADKPDLVEVHQDAATAALLARSGPGIPCVLYRHNFLKSPRSAPGRWFRRRRYHALGGLIFVSEATRAAFVSDYPDLDGLAYAIPNAIDPAPWLAPTASREPLLAFAGRAAPEKGFGEMCAALPAVLDAHPQWRFECCALDWARWADWAETQVAPLARFEDRVVIRRDQPIESVRTLLKRADIAVVPSVFAEPFGLAAIEAHAAGAAVISSGRGGLREASGDTAVYLDEVIPPSITAAMNRLITDPDWRRHLAQMGQDRVRNIHNAEKRAAELNRVRAEIMARFRQ